MATHAGYFFAFQSKVTVLPDVGIAVLSLITGENGNNLGNYQNRVTNFVLDTLLGIESRAKCSDFQSTQRFPSNADCLQNQEDPFLEEIVSSVGMRLGTSSGADYAGTYGNFAMGNITITYDNETDTLLMNYGVHGNMLLEEISPNFFLGTVLEPYWFSPPIGVAFGSSDGETWDLANIPFFFPFQPEAMTFVRGRMLADAPEPDDDDCSDFN